MESKNTKDITSRIAELESRVVALESIVLVAPSPKIGGGRPLGISQFMREKTPKNFTEAALAAAVYDFRYNSNEYFSANVLVSLIVKSRRKKPSNMNDVVNSNVEKGYFESHGESDDGRKRWYVTDLGIALVDDNFGRDEKDS